MQSLSQIRSLLAARGIRPKHRYGQNFLHDHNQLRKLLEAAAIEPGEVVLEVGPGTGTLTEELVGAGAEVIACEIDADMAAIVRERLGDRIILVEGDCLEGKRALAAPVRAALAGRPFKLVANLPYQCASPLMALLASEHPECRGQFVTIQKEVADRLTSPPGRDTYGPLSIAVQAFAGVRLIGTVPPGCFWPEPEVTSAMVAIVPRADHGIDDPRAFTRFVTDLFTRRRKQLGAILGRTRPFPPGMEPAMRPEVLDVPKLVALWRAFVAG